MMMSRTRAVVAFIAAAGLMAGAGVSAQRITPETPMTTLLNRVSGRVRQYYDRAQTIVATESVQEQEVAANLAPTGLPRRLVNEIRIEWRSSDDPDGVPEAEVVRKLLTINGQAPGAGNEPACTDPTTMQEPLFMLLSENRRKFGFSMGKPTKLGGRPATEIDYISKTTALTEPTWKGDCVAIPLEGHTYGSIYVDPETDEVLRLDEHLGGMIDIRVPPQLARVTGSVWMSLERADFSISYKAIPFTNPDEVIVLPSSIVTTRFFRNSGMSRKRLTYTYSDYRRFLTAARVVPPIEVKQ